MDKENEIDVPQQGEFGTSSCRHSGVIVPDTGASSSSHGLTDALTAGAFVELASSAVDDDREVEIEEDPLGISSCQDNQDNQDNQGNITVISDADTEEMETKTPPPSTRSTRRTRATKRRKQHPFSPTKELDSTDDDMIVSASIRSKYRKNRIVETPDKSVTAPLDTVDSDEVAIEKTISGSVLDSRKAEEERTPHKESRKVNKVEHAADAEQVPALTQREIELFGKTEAAKLGTKGLEWLDEVDRLRAKSGNLSGKVSGQMKQKVYKAKELIRTLVGRVDTVGDPTYLRAKNTELTAQLKAAKRRENEQRDEIDEQRKEIKELKKAVRELQYEVRTLKGKANNEGKAMKSQEERKESKVRDKVHEGKDSYLKDRIEKSRADPSTPIRRDLAPPPSHDSGQVLVKRKDINTRDQQKEEEEIDKQISILLKKKKDLRGLWDSEEGRVPDRKGEGMAEDPELQWTPLPQRPPRSAKPKVLSVEWTPRWQLSGEEML